MRRIKFSGSTVTDLGSGVVLISDGSDGGGGSHNILSLDHLDTWASDTPANSDVLTWVQANSRWEAKPAPASGGGGGTEWGDGKPYVWTPPSSPATEDDEFNDDTNMSGPTNGLDAKWSKHNLGTAGWTVLDDTVAPGCVVLDIPTGQSTDQHLYQIAPAGDFTIHARIAQHHPSDRQMWFICILDTNGDGVGVGLDNGDSNIYARSIDNWQQTGSSTSVGSSNTVGQEVGHGLPLDLWLKKESTTYKAAVSWNDRLLVPTFVTTHSITSFTAAYITFGRIFGGGSTKAILDYFRVT